MSDSLCLGIDIGGSKTAAGLVDQAGRVLRRSQRQTPAGSGPSAIIETVAELVRGLLADGTAIVGIGIGSAGVIQDGTVVSATGLLADWAGTDLVALLRATLDLDPQLPMAAINDVHAHGLGEAWVGAGAGRSSILLAAVGTGLGGSVVRDGVLEVGAHGAAGHLGHVPSPEAGNAPCSCGEHGHLEAIASGYGLVRCYHEAGGDPRVIDARSVTDRADEDDHARTAVLRSAGALGRGLGGVINIVDPQAVIISGGLIGSGELWWRTLRASIAGSTLPLLSGIEVAEATLGEDAAVIGAARLGFNAADGRA